MAKRVALIVLAFALVVAVVFTGCAPARRPMNTPGTQTGYRTGYGGANQNMDYRNNPDLADNWGARDWANNYAPDMYNRDLNNNLGNNVNFNKTTRRADDVARTCEQVTGVENATVVVAGNTAYVGVDLDKNTGLANERDIKNAVAQKVRASGQDINTVYVSADADFMTRLRNIGAGVRNGRPVEGFTTELNNMIQRITPTRW